MSAFTKKTFAAKLMHKDKTLLQNGCIKSLSFTELRKILFFSILKSLMSPVIKVSLLM